VDQYSFDARLWRWAAKAESSGSWIFVTLPLDTADDIRARSGEPRGFGSVRVEVRIGSTVWRTSVFPSADEDSYVLPVKKAVRTAEGLDEGDTCTVAVRLIDG